MPLPPPTALADRSVRAAPASSPRDSVPTPMLTLQRKSSGMSAGADGPERQVIGRQLPDLPFVHTSVNRLANVSDCGGKSLFGFICALTRWPVGIARLGLHALQFGLQFRNLFGKRIDLSPLPLHVSPHSRNRSSRVVRG